MEFKKYTPQQLRFGIEVELKTGTDDVAAASMKAIANLKKDPLHYERQYQYSGMGKARIVKYKRRWKGKDGKWEYEYYDQKSRENKIKEKREEKENLFLSLKTKEQYEEYINDNYMEKAKKLQNEVFKDGRKGYQILMTMGDYQNFWYKDINKDLRNDEVDDITGPKVNDMDFFIDNFKIKDNITMYRGLAFDVELKKGDIFEHKSFGSFTSNPFEATQHGFEAVIECNFNKGSDVAPMIFERNNKLQCNDGEQEFIAKHGMIFKVLSKSKKNNIDYYKVEVYHEQ
jgi:hypothetical protein